MSLDRRTWHARHVFSNSLIVQEPVGRPGPEVQMSDFFPAISRIRIQAETHPPQPWGKCNADTITPA